MKKQLIVTGLLFSAVLAPTLSNAETSTANVQTTASTTKTAETETKSQKITIQKIVTEKGAVIQGGAEVKKAKGVNGASFKVYEITPVLTDFLKPYLDKVNGYEKLKATLQEHASEETTETTTSTSSTANSSTSLSATPRTSSSEATTSNTETSTTSTSTTTSSRQTTDKSKEQEELQKLLEALQSEHLTSNQLTEKLTALAKKQDVKKMPVFAQGTTQNSNGKDGLFEFTVPVEESSYRAFYVVNDSVKDNNATTSEPFVLITPVMDSVTGVPMEQAFVYPKSQVNPKEEPRVKLPKTYANLPNTGIQGDWLSGIFNLLFKA